MTPKAESYLASEVSDAKAGLQKGWGGGHPVGDRALSRRARRRWRGPPGRPSLSWEEIWFWKLLFPSEPQAELQACLSPEVI